MHRLIERLAGWRPALLALAVGTCWPCAAVPQQDYADSFRSGVQAYERHRFKEAADAMQRALEVRPQESDEGVKITGDYRQAYIPHFFRGAALFALGDCAGALREWKESERQGFAGYGRDERDIVSQRQATCLAPLLDERAKSADAELDQADHQRQLLLQLEATPAYRDALSDAASQRRAREALDALSAAREQVRAAKAAKDLDAMAHAQDVARHAGAELRAVMDQAAARVQQAATSARGGAPAGAANGAPAPARTSPAPPGATSSPEPSPRRTVAPPAAATIPERLRAGVRSYFAGRYAETVRTLEAAHFDEPSAEAEAALFLAASRMSQFWLSGMRERTLLEGARRDVARCKRLDRGLAPDRRVFSPRFLAFFADPERGAPAPRGGLP